MALRAILRRKRFTDNYLNDSMRTVLSLQCLGQLHSLQNLNSHHSTSLSEDASLHFNPTKCKDEILVPKEEPPTLSGLGEYWQGCYGVTRSGLRGKRSDFNSLIGVRWMPHLIRNASTAAAKQAEPGSDDEDIDELVAKKRKEASPEECDQVVEGLRYI